MGLENFKKYCDSWTDESLKSDLKKFAKDFLLENANEVIIRTKLRTPVDTGKLRASWQHDEVVENGNDFSVDVLNNTEYASYVEYGHEVVVNGQRTGKYVKGNYMLSKSMNEVENKMPDKFETKFKKFLNDRGIGNG